jgi:alpha-tubulin suppressor-like RCC1 family protein
VVIGALAVPWTMARVSAENSEGAAGAPRAAASRIAAGAAHSCAITPEGAVYCWGRNGRGTLGVGSTAAVGDDEAPTAAGPVSLGAGFKAVGVAAGSNHTCALSDAGLVNCWGRNDLGQLGRGNLTDLGDDETPESAGPLNLGAGRTAKAIAAGAAHTCAILDTNGVVCWGANDLGQLGYGNLATIGDDETAGSAGPVSLGAGRTAVAITAGGAHTCAILDNGGVLCWGFGQSGQLGLGVLPDAFTVGGGGGGGGGTGFPVDPNCYDLVFIGADCPRPGSGGGGGGGGGGTGTGLIAIGDNEAPGQSQLVNLGAGRTATAISAGFSHTCALLDDGTIRCWGRSSSGELGIPNPAGLPTIVGDDEVPGSLDPVDLGPGRTAVALSAGYAHSCAVLDNGTARCWGSAAVGQLGTGNTTNLGDNEAPSTATVLDLGPGRTAVAVSAGGYLRALSSGATVLIGHTCALLDDGSLRCWGGNETGQLGLGNSSNVGDDEVPGSAAIVALPGMPSAPDPDPDPGPALDQGTYVGQTPDRLLDTRLGVGAPRARVGAGGKLQLTVAQGSGVLAVALNVTAVQPTEPTYLSLYPVGGTQPLVSNVNAGAGRTVPNLVVVKVGSNNQVELFNAAGQTDVIVDKLGEFRASGGEPFVPADPVRVLDTRIGLGAATGEVGAASSIELQLGGVAGIPADADSVVLNVTAVAPSDPTFVTVFPSGGGLPLASNLNPDAGQTVPNLVIAKLGAGGKVTLFNAEGAVHLVADVMGWYGSGSPGSVFVPVNPMRIADTRPGVADAVPTVETCATAPGTACTVKLTVAGSAGIPAGATAVALNVGVEPGALAGLVSVGTAPSTEPATSNVNYGPFQTLANAVVVKITPDGAVYLNVPIGPVPLFVDLQGFYVEPAPATS